MEITTIDPFLAYYKRLRERSLAVIRCIPPDAIEWTYKEGAWTLGDVIRHVAAIERLMWAETVHRRPNRYTECGPGLARGYDKVLEFLNRMHADSLDIFAQLSPADLQRKCTTPKGAQITTWKWLRALCEHEIHHRGQIYIYLGILGVQTPPLYGLTAEDVAQTAQG